MREVKRSPFLRYAIAILLVAVATLITWSLQAEHARTPFAFYFIVVVAATIYGGRGPGLLAIALSAILSSYFILPPRFSFLIGYEGIVQLGVFLFVALVISSLAERASGAERKTRMSEASLRITLQSIGDAVIATDAKGRITFMNQVAQELTGWRLEEVSGRDLAEVFHIINEQSRRRVESPAEKVLREGVVVGLANHTMLVTRDGLEIPIDDSGAPIKDEDGNVTGVVLVFHDITQRRLGEEATLRLAAIVESTEDAIFGKTLDGIIASWNKGAERLYGYAAEEMIGKSISILLPPDRPEELKLILETVRRGEHIKQFETVRVRKDGRRINVSLTISPIKNEGRIVGVSTIARNITEQKQAEEMFRLAVESAPNAMVMVDESGSIVLINSQAEKLFGYSREELIGQSAEILVPERFRKSQPEYKQVFAAQPQARVMGAGISLYGLRKDGTEVPVEIGLNSIETEKGRLVLSSIVDITERKRAEAALRESEERFAKAFESSPLALTITSLKTGRLLEVNDTFTQLSGYTRDEAVGHTTLELGLWSKPSDRESELGMIAERGRVHNIEYRFRMRDGRELVGLLSAERIEIGGEPCALTVIQDVTERKQAEVERERLLQRERRAREEAEEANRLKDEFLATLSHELRTPLTAMLGWTRMLRTKQLDENTSIHALETIERNVRAQTQLIEDLLDVSRIITGKLRLETRPVELVPVIEAAIDSIQPAAEAKEIVLERALDPTASPVLGDTARLQQVVWNLLSNAVKFTPKGGRVRVSLERSDSYAAISVTDTGVGISQEFLPYVFDRFRQADSSSTRAHGGLGLGLAIVRHLVELHGGIVSATSDGTQRGARFTVNLPLMAVNVRRPMLAETDGDGDESEGALLECPSLLQGVRILVVDDEADARQLLSTILGQCEAVVEVAANAKQAIEALKRKPPDLLISDIGMPDEDGYGLLQKLRSDEDPRLKELPALALTGYASEEDRTRTLNAGFQIHLAKPVDPQSLIAACEQLVKKDKS
ncbi:MAG: PAS domain S-box protein [Pyrinomonadaceae bacterium]|nr:PAS domain S-box protein [Pyrinomonadaceae bacterium]